MGKRNYDKRLQKIVNTLFEKMIELDDLAGEIGYDLVNCENSKKEEILNIYYESTGQCYDGIENVIVDLCNDIDGVNHPS